MDINKIKEKIGLFSDSPVWREAEPTVLQIPINQVTAYRCPSCRRVYLSKLSAVRHAVKCVKNPYNKTCLSCMNHIVLAEDVKKEDRCHCSTSLGEELIEKAKYVESYNGEDADYYYTGHDVVWDCPHYKQGIGWLFNLKDYEDALDLIDKLKALEEKQSD